MQTATIHFDLPDAAATRQLGQHLGRSLPPSSVLLLEGNLGSGKTTLVQSIGEGLGIVEPIASPTFILICEYLEGRLPLYHLDLYRLDPNQVAELQPERYWDNREVAPGITAIEWAERLPELPPAYLRIRLSYPEETDKLIETDMRRVELSQVGDSPVLVLEQLLGWVILHLSRG
jgi:tRNA threonylcarbamoyladenosine biosynthesis protein TsaE